MKHIKMILYGEPGVGKSTFAVQFPKPYFICTDGNYEYLEDFGADPNAHIEVASYDAFKKLVDSDFKDYDTIVVDLLEDLFKMNEVEYCTRNKLEHISDVGFAKGYDSTRTDFFITISKLLQKPKNIVLIMHGVSYTEKDRRGVEHTRHCPSGRLPDKVLDMLEGRVRYALRCYLKDEEQADGKLLKKRYLSIIPKSNEWGIARGINESVTPEDIDLDFAQFAKYVGYEPATETAEPEQAQEPEEKKTRRRRKQEEQPETPAEQPDPKTPAEPEKPTEQPVEQPTEQKTTAEPEQPTEKPVATSNEDRIAAIKAKLAAMKGN